MTSGARISFMDLMALEAVGEGSGKETSMSRRPPFSHTGMYAYGGHVYSQAVYAASHSVENGMIVHNVHGYFTHPARTDRPYVYTVSRLSEGRTYSARLVTVRQPILPTPILSTGLFDCNRIAETGNICFTCICSFKKPGTSTAKHQVKLDLEVHYGSAILGKSPDEHKVMPSLDFPWYHKVAAAFPRVAINEFPGLDMRRVDMSNYNESKSATEYRQLNYYKPIGSIPPSNYNLHACAHLYASDRNSLFLICNAMNYADEVANIGSLSHSVVFHVAGEGLVLKEGDWWCQEEFTSRSGDGRGLHESRIWDKHGVHIASTWQDGMIKMALNEEDLIQKKSWFEAMERSGKLPPGTWSDMRSHKL